MAFLSWSTETVRDDKCYSKNPILEKKIYVSVDNKCADLNHLEGEIRIN